VTRLPRLIVAIASVALTGTTALGQMVEAPVYTSWSKVPVGTTITLRTIIESNDGQTAESTTTQRLVSKGEKEVVVEQLRLAADGEEIIQTFKHRRLFPLLGGMKPEDIGKPKDALAQGEETLEIAGKPFEATWYDQRSQTEAGPAITRSWIADDVPGRLLKAVTRLEQGKTSTTTIDLVKIETP
jgi:hypothetical protein